MSPAQPARRSPARRPPLPLTLLAAAGLAVSLSACSNSPTGEKDVDVGGPVQTVGPQPSMSPSATPSSTSSASLTPSASGSATPSGASGVEVVEIDVSGRTVTPQPGRVEIEGGTQLRIVLTSDVDNVIHVHGLDLEKPVKAGETLTWEIVPQQAGVYEVELHEPQLLLFKLAIR